jgi:hypothetical protein
MVSSPNPQRRRRVSADDMERHRAGSVFVELAQTSPPVPFYSPAFMPVHSAPHL